MVNLETVKLIDSKLSDVSQNHNTWAPKRNFDLSNSALNEDQKVQLNTLLNEYSDLFANHSYDLGRTHLATHEISVENAAPVKQRPYRVSHTNKPKIKQHLQDMLHHDIIRPSQSPWSSPVIIIGKKDGGSRLVVDYRQLNSLTRKDSYPLPRIDDTLDCLGGASYFSVLDFCSGYFQIPLAEQSKQYTAFTTLEELFEFNVMPFGLTNAPSTFQRLMETVLRGLQWKICLVYIDDIIIFSPTFEQHLQYLATVFDRLREAGLKLKPSKCRFGCYTVPYLGFSATPSGIPPDPKKIEAVRTYPVPQNLTQLRAFLGLANYYRRFISGFVRVAQPLTALTRKDTPFAWTQQCQEAFDRLKIALTTAPVFAYPDFNLEFILYTDASSHSLGAVLAQIQNGREVVIAYSSRVLTAPKKNYSITEKEALAVLNGIKQFMHYLQGNHFVICTDHAALKWLMSIKEPTGRLAPWALTIQQFSFTIKHCSGKTHGNADALSRRPIFPTIAAIKTVQNSGFQKDYIQTLQHQDERLPD